MSDVRNTRWAEQLRRLISNFSAATGGSLIDDLFPMLPLLDAAAGEQAFLRADRRLVANLSAPAVVGQFSTLFFGWGTAARADENFLVVIERIIAWSATAMSLTVGFEVLGTGAAPTSAFSDARNTGVPITGAVASSAAGAKPSQLGSFPLSASQIEVLGVDPIIIPRPKVIASAPTGIVLQGQTVNTAFQGIIVARERYCEPDELR